MVLTTFFIQLKNDFTIHNGWDLAGAIAGLLLAAVILIGLPSIIHDFKNHYSQRREREFNKVRNREWMTFLLDFAKKQGQTIEDYEVSQCWDLFIRCIETFTESDDENWGGRFSVNDINNLIYTMDSNVMYEGDGIGINARFTITIIGNDRLAVKCLFVEKQCNTSLMAEQLKIFKQHFENSNDIYMHIMQKKRDKKEDTRTFWEKYTN